MLHVALAAHPGTSLEVLGVLARCDTPYAAITARARLGWDNPWEPISSLTALRAEVKHLLETLDLTVTQRRTLFEALPTVIGTDLITTRVVTGDDLRTITTLIRGTDDPSRELWLRNVATNPNTPTDLVIEVLRDLLAQNEVAPATVLVALDNHHIPPREIAEQIPDDIHHHVLAWLLESLETAGSLLALLERVGLESDPNRILDWESVAVRTTNPDVAVALTRRALSSTDLREAQTYNQLLLRLITLDNIPPDAYRTIGRLIYDAGAYAALQHRIAAPLARQHDLTGDLLDQVVNRARTRPVCDNLLDNPNLTAAHLEQLRGSVEEHVGGIDSLSLLARIARHPNVSDTTRTAASAAAMARVDGWRDTPGPGPFLTEALLVTPALLGNPIIAAQLPVNPSAIMRRTLLPAVTETLDRHPAVLSNPDLARTALTLAPDFQGTLEDLLATAAGITS